MWISPSADTTDQGELHIITSNLVFSAWDRIFKDAMTTAAAIDRLVHHAVIVEMVGKSIRVPESGEPTTAKDASTVQDEPADNG